MDSVKLSKKTLRLKISKIKKSYSKEELKTMSVPIIKKLLSDSLFIESSTILLYNSLPDEVCTHHLLQMCCQEKQILLPTVVGDKLELHIYDPDKTATGPYGITESRGPLFGDSGTALALEFDTTAEDILIEFNTMGSGYQALMTPHGGYRHPVTQESFVEENFGNGIIRAPKDALIKGMDVFSFAITKPSIGVKKMLEQEGLDKDKDVDYFLIHQANKLIVDRLVKKLKLPKEKVPYNLQKFGNLGGASILMLMVSEIAEDLSLRPLTLLCSSFGLGLTWGTMILKTQPLIVLPLNKL